MELSERLHLGFPEDLLARALMMPLLPNLVVAPAGVPTGVSRAVLHPQAAGLVAPGPTLPARGQLDRGEAGVPGHLEVSDFRMCTYSADIRANFEPGFGGSESGSATDTASDASGSAAPSWFGSGSEEFSGGWWNSRVMRHRQ